MAPDNCIDDSGTIAGPDDCLDSVILQYEAVMEFQNNNRFIDIDEGSTKPENTSNYNPVEEGGGLSPKVENIKLSSDKKSGDKNPNQENHTSPTESKDQRKNKSSSSMSRTSKSSNQIMEVERNIDVKGGSGMRLNDSTILSSKSKDVICTTSNRRSNSVRQVMENQSNLSLREAPNHNISSTTGMHYQQYEGISSVSTTTAKPLQKGLNKLTKSVGSLTDQDEDSTSVHLNSTKDNEKTRRIGTLPSYNFSFKCDERAEKRKEFYSKLEERIHEREIEKSNLQAKTKESQEAELKLLRKSLTFKATPMPTFYQEPPPPKMELKKIPPTRAKSPKFCRPKPSPITDSEKNDDQIGHSSVASMGLDEKMSQKNHTKDHQAPINMIKPRRKSLLKLHSKGISSSVDKDLSVNPSQTVTINTKTTECKIEEPVESE